MAEQPNPETGLVVYQSETERFRLSLRPSAIGISAGMVAANITHSIMDSAVQATSSTAAAGINTIGYVAEKIVEYTIGPTASLPVMYARHAAADTTRNSIRAYSPLTSMIASAAVGTTTALAVTAGEAVIRVSAPVVKSAVLGTVSAATTAASRVYNSFPSREQLWSALPHIRFNSIITPVTAIENDLSRPAFGDNTRTDLISGINFQPSTPEQHSSAPPSTPLLLTDSTTVQEEVPEINI
jgi:hypothetical protein